jgi:L-alanine-DL-glutamate epimerase-like enolase superfamily enzyme
MVKIAARQLALRLENPFKLSYGTSTVRENVLIEIDDGKYTGVGEAAVVPYYHETPARILTYCSDPAVAAAVGDDPYLIEDELNRLPPAESSAARAAVDMALHDRWAQHLGQPLYRLWGLNPARIPDSSFTVAMADDEAVYREHIRAARAYKLIKLKLGSGDWRTDWRVVQIAREETTARLGVDANGGWSVEDAQAIIPRLADMGIEFIEQPVTRDNLAGWRTLRTSLPEKHPPLIADESVQGVESVPPLAGIVDGINIKLAKCGGLRPARQMIMLARAYSMKVMIGCMIESSVAVTAAAQLAPLADFADLDGNLLITNDPYRGLQVDAGRVTLPNIPGLGVKPYVE